MFVLICMFAYGRFDSVFRFVSTPPKIVRLPLGSLFSLYLRSICFKFCLHLRRNVCLYSINFQPFPTVRCGGIYLSIFFTPGALPLRRSFGGSPPGPPLYISYILAILGVLPPYQKLSVYLLFRFSPSIPIRSASNLTYVH